MIIGSQGMLGMEMFYYLQDKYEVIPFDYFNLDITNRELVQSKLAEYKPEIVINCAAYTDVERAEAEYERKVAQEVNGEAVGYLADVCSHLGITLVQISTDYVFDGKKGTAYKEDDLPNPLNIYGKSKYLGEQKVLEEAQKNPDFQYYIVRTAWLYGQYGPGFVKKMLHLGKKQREVNVVDDQFGSPTWTYALSQGIESLIEQKKYTKGVYHLTGKGETSWAEFAEEIFRLKKFNARVKKVDSSFFQTQAKRPKCSALENTKGPEMLGWKEMLGDYLG